MVIPAVQRLWGQARWNHSWHDLGSQLSGGSVLAPLVSGRLCSCGGERIAEAIVGAGILGFPFMPCSLAMVALQEVLNESRHLLDVAVVRPLLGVWEFPVCQQVHSSVPASKLRCD